MEMLLILQEKDKHIKQVIIFILYYLSFSLNVYSQEVSIPYGIFLVESVGNLTINGQIAILDDSMDVGQQIYLTPHSLIFRNENFAIDKIIHRQYTEKDFLEEWGGSGQAPLTFNVIGFDGTILNDFWIRFIFESLEKITKSGHKIVNTIYILSEDKYLIIGELFYFCRKIG